ncbi:23S rRNA (guanine(745)-N(1))-methyltransferase [Edwardsiella ictaluri]|uniref:Methyltransferase domain protein n=2 Tax=Edwardsiella ictaluri TaxID=67780 RepID=C5BDX5_EDWI9|nr:23S rRNA (guanine(745)-N(1))-methyltransferase [Edwardsiella ictaluri]ACR68898.1 methyltransferase domain protein [Edwardsiella ictaluri 93-146]ARD38303.1 23S rRNA (guanine(745)-N(1))-methyltransferase [Edwardsiella ictaluri]AVZ80869.1 23S rRNA (guanine(745)-N(1))-methyltransferase [Edwardsiella ictaluri]EKS7764387.1 23S rRNA (guanine(745)-N(1))-methyltransferase [Edwardsiella ictaluri]EKS7771284.1 23S rRNA (guanine(745)-N(1))-methyltransferase [Edwardsiella ictaluri]
MPYQCPLCHSPLHQDARQWRCVNNHRFDCAKEGYVNLMPVQFKHSRQPGDSSEMMQARRAFLQADHYLPLRDAVQGLLARYLPSDGCNVLDIGCGEGYYTASWASVREAQVYGLDIAKVAIRYAARRYPQAHFCVASSLRLPFADASIGGAVRIYAPCNAQELARVVATGGCLVTVTPAERHLYQLKALVYPAVHLHMQKAELLSGFTLLESQRLGYAMALNGVEAAELLQMTPFAWRAPQGVAEALQAREAFECETDFLIRVYRRD